MVKWWIGQSFDNSPWTFFTIQFPLVWVNIFFWISDFCFFVFLAAFCVLITKKISSKDFPFFLSFCLFYSLIPQFSFCWTLKILLHPDFHHRRVKKEEMKCKFSITQRHIFIKAEESSWDDFELLSLISNNVPIQSLPLPWRPSRSTRENEN